MITKDNVEDYIGPPIFSSKKFYKELPPGVVIGLAYNSVGGGILYIEGTQSSYPKNGNNSEHSRGSLKVTGSLGDVMKESSMIAQTYAKNFLQQRFAVSHPHAVDFLE